MEEEVMKAFFEVKKELAVSKDDEEFITLTLINELFDSVIYDKNSMFVASTDGKNLYLGDGFLRFPKEQRKFIIRHELMHIILRHPRVLGKINQLKNIAADLNINTYLGRTLPVPYGIVYAPENELKEVLGIKGNNTFANLDAIKRKGKFPIWESDGVKWMDIKEDPKLPPEYFRPSDKDLTDKDVKDIIKRLGEDPLSKKIKDELKKQLKKQGEGQGEPYPIDEAPDDLKDDLKGKSMDQVKDALKKALKKVAKDIEDGNISDEMKKQLEDVKKKLEKYEQDFEDNIKERKREIQDKVSKAARNLGRGYGDSPLYNAMVKISKYELPWDWILRNIMVEISLTNYSSTRFQRRFIYRGLYLPALHEDKATILIAVDTSGSINDEIYGKFIFAVNDALTVRSLSLEAVLYEFTDKCHYRGTYDVFNQIPRTSWSRESFGGTDASCIFNEVLRKLEEEGKIIALIVVLTDGYLNKPENYTDDIDAKTVWVITNEEGEKNVRKFASNVILAKPED